MIVALAIFGAGAAAWLFDASQPELAIPAPAELEGRVVTAIPGVRVLQVFVAKGNRVKDGQILLQLDLTGAPGNAQTSASSQRISAATVEAAGSLLQRISPQMWMRLMVTDPQLLAAEQEYADALLADEREHSEETGKRMRRATAQRLTAQQRLSHLTPGSLEALGDLFRKNEDAEKWLARERAASEVRAPVGGRVEIFDLRPGDHLPPSGRVALIAVDSAPKELR